MHMASDLSHEGGDFLARRSLEMAEGANGVGGGGARTVTHTLEDSRMSPPKTRRRLG